MGNVKNMPNTNMDILEEVSLPLLCFWLSCVHNLFVSHLYNFITFCN
jgi:hypothetical protein